MQERDEPLTITVDMMVPKSCVLRILKHKLKQLGHYGRRGRPASYGRASQQWRRHHNHLLK